MTAPLHGLVLIGGHSSRFGEDKSRLAYHGVPQWRYACDLLADYCESVFLSAREDQSLPYPTLVDEESGLGPVSGFRSAFRKSPAAAWLVLACDLPGVNREAVQWLRDHRDPEADATAFGSPESPEPLFSLWEPTGLRTFYERGGSPRAALISFSTIWVPPKNPGWITNVNTPAERAAFTASRNKISDAGR